MTLSHQSIHCNLRGCCSTLQLYHSCGLDWTRKQETWCSLLCPRTKCKEWFWIFSQLSLFCCRASFQQPLLESYCSPPQSSWPTHSPTILNSPNFSDNTLSIAAQLAADANLLSLCFQIISSSLPLAPYTDELAPHDQNSFPLTFLITILLLHNQPLITLTFHGLCDLC